MTWYEDNVEIGDGTKLLTGANLRSGRVGCDCTIHPYAVVGGEPQDLKFVGEDSVVSSATAPPSREYATISRGTASKGYTKVGSDVLIMVYAHVARLRGGG